MYLCNRIQGNAKANELNGTSIFCGNSSVGRARPCQGRGREFESRFPLKIFRNIFCPGGGMVDALVSGASVERRAGSSPVLGTLLLKKGESSHAEIAQLVEHNLAKVRVASSSLVFRSFQIKKSRKHCSVLAGFFCCMEVVVTVSVMRIRASFRRSCWPASRYSSEWSCCFCWRGRLSVSVACPIRTAGP